MSRKPQQKQRESARYSEREEEADERRKVHTKRRARHIQLLLDQPRVGVDVGSVNLDTLDGTDSLCVGVENTGFGEFGQDGGKELFIFGQSTREQGRG